MKKILTPIAAILLSVGAIAQDARTEKDLQKTRSKEDANKMNEYDEIIIKRKNSDKDSKVTIEIKDDEVFVDGKPLDDYNQDEMSIRKRGARKYRLEGPGSPFRFEQGWSLDGDDLLIDDDRPFLGVTSEGSTEGVKVTMVSENSAAAKAGLKKGDIITKVNDKAVFDHEQLSEAIGKFKPDDKVTITYKRDGKENKTTATLGERPRAQTLRGRVAPIPPQPPIPLFEPGDNDFGDVFQYYHSKPRLGLKVQDTEDGKGVKVLDVDEGSAAEKAGIKKDDVITSFEGKDVTSASELAKASRDAKDKSSFKVQLNRNGKSQSVDVKVPKKLKTANL
ncbi:MAG: PDZ domain-containing protein [Chitinophagaceae bacterium]|nr:PDZ domain-containing protein [Chitinophagaceae bacterium]